MLPPHLAWICEAFAELGTCQTQVGRIPWQAIEQYAAAYGVGEPERFRYLIRACEDELAGSAERKAKEPRSITNPNGRATDG